MNTKKIIFRIIECIILALLFIIFVFPFYWTLITSVKGTMEAVEYPPTMWPRKFVWTNYSEAWVAGHFSTYGLNSIIMTIGATLLQITASVPAAYAFARMEFKGKKILFAIILADIMIPAQAIFLPIFLMYSKLGILNTYISYFMIFVYSGSTIFFFRNAFKQVPEELLEAARLDGASELSVMFRVLLPTVKPFLITQLLLIFISKWNGYFWVQVLTTNDTIRTLPLALNNIVNQVDAYVIRWDWAMACNVMMMAPLLIAYIFANNQMKTAFAGNGIK